jgi:superkiller protein 3
MLPLLVTALLAAAAATDAHQRGVSLYRQQKYAEAIPVLEEATKSESPESAEYRESVLLIGQSYFVLSQATKAIPWLEKIPSVNEANYMLGYAYFLAGKHEQSEAAFARLFELKPDSAAGHLVAGQMLLKKEYQAEALSEINRALAMDTNLPEAHFLAAEIAIAQGQLAEAIDHLHKELTINPNFSMAWYRLGDALARQEKWDDAIPNLQRAVWLNQNYSGPYILLGKCYFKTHSYVNAEGILKRALAIDPQNESATYLLAQTLEAEGKKDEAAQMLQKLKHLKQQ